MNSRRKKDDMTFATVKEGFVHVQFLKGDGLPSIAPSALLLLYSRLILPHAATVGAQNATRA